MEKEDEIEKSRRNLWLIIVDGRDVVHHEVEDYRHANRIINHTIFGPQNERKPALEPYPLFTAEHIPAGTRVCGMEVTGGVLRGPKGYFAAYLMNDRQRNAYLAINTEEKTKVMYSSINSRE